MVVFVEYVLIDNFIIDYLLLKTAFVLFRVSYKKYRLIISAFLGAIFSLLYPLISLHETLLVIIKVLFGCAITLSAVKYDSFYQYIKITAIFFSFTFFVGGAIIGIYNLLGLNYSAEISVALMFLPVYLLIKFGVKAVRSVVRAVRVEKLFFSVELSAFGVKLKLKGLLDTGNGVYYENSPVIFISRTIYVKLLSGANELPKIKKIPFYTVSGREENISFKSDELIIYFGNKKNTYNNVVVAVAKGKLTSDVILHGDFIKESEYEKDVKTIEKVS